MTTTLKQICEEFSMGNFGATYDHFADDIRWNIIGDKIINGKQNVIGYCEKMMIEMDSSVLINTNVVAENNCFAIEGNCKYIDKNGQPAELNYCDVYRIENNKIETITSYCISQTINP